MLKVCDKFLVFLMILGLFSSSSYVPPALGQGFEPSIVASVKEIKDFPENYVDKKITFKGVLRYVDTLEGHEWRLEDEMGNQVEVTSWAPYEIILPFSKEARKKMPKTMSYYVDKDLKITGRLKFNTGEFPNIKSKYYVDVASAKEMPGK